MKRPHLPPASPGPAEMAAREAPSPLPGVTVIVPTMGRSRWLVPCLEALRRQSGVGSIEILVVDQASRPVELPARLADRVLRPGGNVGFARGTNLGLGEARGELLATVNDDALVDPGWLAALAAVLRADPSVAAVQGVNLLLVSPQDQDVLASTDLARQTVAAKLGAPATPATPAGSEAERIDSCGLGWNRWWQAVQLGHGERTSAAAGTAAAAPMGTPPAMIEVFGVSATAALYRRSALERVARDGQVFDPRLVSYYEDADLANRLRAAGFRAGLVPAARARHAGSASQGASGLQRWRLVYGNRYLVAASLLGRGFWPRLPGMFLRDTLDLLGRVEPRDRRGRAGIVAGWGRALLMLPAFARRGAPALAPAEVARLSRLPGEAA